MNATQMLAWLVCLIVAFFAAVLAVNAGYKLALMEKEFRQANQTVAEEAALLGEIRSVLKEIELDLRSRRTPAPAAGSEPAEAPRPASVPAAAAK